MSSNETVIIAGTGEVGLPLLKVLSRVYHCTGVDITPVQIDLPCSVFHVCYPFQISDFVGTTVRYVEQYQPNLVIINSTVPIGTSRKVQDRLEIPVVFSPVRGKHARMVDEMLVYRKFVAGFTPSSTDSAAQHFSAAGMPVAIFRTPEIAEYTKLIETSWLGVLVAWAQEIERMGIAVDASYEEVNEFMKEIAYLPTHIFPGKIGGHCVMPNIELLRAHFSSDLLDAIVQANADKEQRLRQDQLAMAISR